MRGWPNTDVKSLAFPQRIPCQARSFSGEAGQWDRCDVGWKEDLTLPTNSHLTPILHSGGNQFAFSIMSLFLVGFLIPNAIFREPEMQCNRAMEPFLLSPQSCSCLQAEASPQHLAPWLPNAPCTFRLHLLVNQSLHSSHQWGSSDTWIPLKTERQFSSHILDEQCGRSIMVHLQMSSVPQTSVLRVPVQALLAAKAPAAGQHQPRHCQHLAAIPLWSHKDRKLWGLNKVSASDKWKRKTLLQPCTPETKREVEFFLNLSIYKKQHPNKCLPLWRDKRGERGKNCYCRRVWVIYYQCLFPTSVNS